MWVTLHVRWQDLHVREAHLQCSVVYLQCSVCHTLRILRNLCCIGDFHRAHANAITNQDSLVTTALQHQKHLQHSCSFCFMEGFFFMPASIGEQCNASCRSSVSASSIGLKILIGTLCLCGLLEWIVFSIGHTFRIFF